jgi:phage portal protein BeeE
MNLIDRVRLSLARPLLRKMARQLLPVISPWTTATFYDTDFQTLDAQAYKGNSAVFACTSVLSFGFIEPSLRVYDVKKEEISHPPTPHQ